MPDEPVVTEPEPEPEPTPTPKEPEPQPEPEPEPDAHPLEPGGKRFEQVYANMRAAESEREALRAEKARLEAELTARRQAEAKPAPTEYTDEQLDAMEEQASLAGNRQALRAIQSYRIEQAVNRKVASLEQQHQARQVATTVGQDLVKQYPALADQNSDLFKAAATEFTTLQREYAVRGQDIQQDIHAAEVALFRAIRKNPALGVKGTTVARKREDTTVVGDEHGAPPASKPTSSTKLTQRELDFCRKSGMDPKEFAKYKPERRRE